MESLAEQMQKRLRRYLGGHSTLESFEDWLVTNTWNVHQRNDRLAEELTGAIELALAEYTSGDRTEDELKAELWHLLFSQALIREPQQAVMPFVVPSGTQPTYTGSRAEISKHFEIGNGGQLHEDDPRTRTVGTEEFHLELA